MHLPVPNDASSLKRALGMFTYYCRWISSFSDKISPLLTKGTFPLTGETVKAFNSLEADIANASLADSEDNAPLRVETDAPEFAIGATLTLRKYTSIEKKAFAIVESLRHWRHYVIGRHFEVLPDQRSVAFKFDQHHSSNVKNKNTMRWSLHVLNLISFIDQAIEMQLLMHSKGKLIKATAPFESFNLDFKGFLTSASRNRFLLTIVDEFSRLPFAMPCPDISAATVIS